MLTLQRRILAGFALVVLLLAGFVTAQLVVSDRLQTRHAAHTARLEAARDANEAVLQHMTDAETGLRGYQITGRRDFLQPYAEGRAAAFRALDVVAARTTDPAILNLVTAERSAASNWLAGYATPIVTAVGTAPAADPGLPLAERGKQLFDELRTVNAAVDTAVRTEQRAVAAADRRESRLVQLAFAALAAAALAGALALGLWGRRQVLAPLEHMRRTLSRLAGGELSARATPCGPREMRTVIETLNLLAAETERLHAADAARILRTDLRQAVAVELREHLDPGAAARRVAALIGETLGADAVHGRIALDDTRGIDVTWPERAPSLSARTVQDIVAGEPGEARDVPHQAGALAVPLDGDGLLYVVRRARPEWSDEERRLLVTLAREVDHAMHQQRLHDRQRRLIRELRVLDERKDTFVATVTHELRTPLTSILGYTEMLADGDGGDLTPLQERGLGAILRNAHRLQATVADLLLLDKASATIGEPATAVDLAAVVTALHGEYASLAQGRGIVFAGEATAAWVTGDERRLARALRNLLDNALKFTGAGGTVTYRVGPDGGSAILAVTDTGIGIPAGDLGDLFTPFHRAANAMDRAVQGPGLGLAIVRTIVTEHGGTVGVTSRVDAGSTFTVTLPLIPAPEALPGDELAGEALSGNATGLVPVGTRSAPGDTDAGRSPSKE